MATRAEILAAAAGNWPFQDNAASTVVAEETGATADAVLVGGDNTAPLAVAGPTAWLPSAFQLDGASDYVNAGADFRYNDEADFSGAAWVKFDAAPTGFAFIAGCQDAAGGNGWRIGNGPGGEREKLAFYFVGSGGSYQFRSTSDVLDTAWHHLGWAWDGTAADALLYFDGELLAGAQVGVSEVAGTSASVANLGIGARQSDGSGKIDGAMAGVVIAETVWSVDDFSALFSNATDPVDPPPPAPNMHKPNTAEEMHSYINRKRVREALQI